MERFIVIYRIYEVVDEENLKSSMERFIVFYIISQKWPKYNLKSSMERFIEDKWGLCVTSNQI